VVSVSADVDGTTNTDAVLAALGHGRTDGVLTELRSDHGVTFLFEGVADAQREAMAGLKQGVLIAIAVIFLLLVLSFRSWLQPLTIIVVVPVALIGAVFGHLLLGLPLTIISIFGLIGLIGIAVNDAITLIHFVHHARPESASLSMAVINAAKRRFRPIIMTSATTIAGLLPLLLERSMQAQFLIPMAVSICFGLLLATIGTLIIVPAAYLVLADIRYFWTGHHDHPNDDPSY
jgi:multidrug efflux pump subunit AcrB